MFIIYLYVLDIHQIGISWD